MMMPRASAGRRKVGEEEEEGRPLPSWIEDEKEAKQQNMHMYMDLCVYVCYILSLLIFSFLRVEMGMYAHI